MPRSNTRWIATLQAAAVLFALVFYLGHATGTDAARKDFLTHWTLARLAATGHRADAYDFATQAELLRREVPGERTEELLTGKHVAGIGVSPYPPVMVVLYAPLGYVAPTTAATILHVVSVLLALASAWAISRSTEGRVSGLATAVAVLYYPGVLYTLALGQNAIITSALFTVGWLAFVRKRDFAAGLIWGLLAYKVHWLVAVGWLPMLFRRPRTLLGMATSAGLLAAIATVWLGPSAWSRWLEQARAIGDAYHTDDFRTTLLGKACDLRAAASRYLPDDLARPGGWAALAMVGVVTLVAFWRGRDKRPDGRAAGMLLAACGLVAPYLFYYDESVFLLPLLTLWSRRDDMSRVRIGLLAAATVGYYSALPVHQYLPGGWDGPPWATLAALAVWAVGIWTTLRD